MKSEFFDKQSAIIPDGNLELLTIFNRTKFVHKALGYVKSAGAIFVSIKSGGSLVLPLLVKNTCMLNVFKSLQNRKVNILTFPTKFVRWTRWSK